MSSSTVSDVAPAALWMRLVVFASCTMAGLALGLVLGLAHAYLVWTTPALADWLAPGWYVLSWVLPSGSCHQEMGIVCGLVGLVIMPVLALAPLGALAGALLSLERSSVRAEGARR